MDPDNISKNLKNHNLRPNLWQNSSEVGLAPKKFQPLAFPIINSDLLKF